MLAIDRIAATAELREVPADVLRARATIRRTYPIESRLILGIERLIERLRGDWRCAPSPPDDRLVGPPTWDSRSVLSTAAVAVVVFHGVAVALMLTGSLLALRWPRLLWLHVPLSLAILSLYLTGSDCPLTTLELWLREQQGMPGYTGGFVGHYLTEPLGFPIHATSTQVGIYAIAFLPNAVGYGLLAVRAGRGRSVQRSSSRRSSTGAAPTHRPTGAGPHPHAAG